MEYVFNYVLNYPEFVLIYVCSLMLGISLLITGADKLLMMLKIKRLEKQRREEVYESVVDSRLSTDVKEGRDIK